MLLDEATSHLDVALEQAINDAVRGLHMTRIVIAHRPQTITACDIVLELPAHNRALGGGSVAAAAPGRVPSRA